jgi:hypothetical protein
MREPLRQTGFITAASLILSLLITLLIALVSREALGQPPSLDQTPYQTAARPQLADLGRWPNFGALLEARQSCRPHPAVARIIVPEGPTTAYGTGTLVDVRDGFGLVITNWHVVREATGVIEVVFPSGFRSQARALKVDADWDLAALVIWQPAIEPVPLAKRAPRPGDGLTIHGYGQGEYRVASGRCTQYYAPRADFPQEMVELNVEARQGDSGGPIFNDQGELAGVLFGAGQGTTIGSFGGRVESFLATLAPDIGRPRSGALVATASAASLADGCHAMFPPACHPCGPCESPAGGNSPLMVQTRESFPNPEDLSAADFLWARSEGGNADREVAEQSPWRDAERPNDSEVAPGEDTSTGNQPLVQANLMEQVKSLLAIIGLVAVCIQIVRVVT